VIGGSGLCSLPGLEIEESLVVETKYGQTSDRLLLGRYGGARVAFIPRHGAGHTIPPHKVPYLANLSALSQLGVRQVLATCVAGSLNRDIEPGQFVVPDQFIDRTWGRDALWTPGDSVRHIPMAEPYCKRLSKVLALSAQTEESHCRDHGTVVVIQGPRFSTVAESRLYSAWGGDIINMTQYPECYFARELGMCYAVIASITDYDVGVSRELSIEAGSFEKILPIFRKNVERTQQILATVLRNRSDFTTCTCAQENVKHYYEN